MENVREWVISKGSNDVEVNLHFHYDKDEDFDYTGGHVLHINSTVGRVTHCKMLDLEGKSEEECRKIQMQVVDSLRDITKKLTKREFTHR